MKTENSSATAADSLLAPRYCPAMIGLIVACLFLFGFRLGSVPLFDLDEALYVSCARQMILHGDYVTPLLNSRPAYDSRLATVPFFEKPIMVYWATAASMKLFGMSEWAARLPVLLAALVMTAAIVWAGHRLFRSPRAGLLAGLVYATVPMTLLDARQMTTDGLLVLWFAGTLGAYWRRKAWLFWTMCALAILTKGIVGLLLPLFIIGIHTLLENRRARRNSLPLSKSPRWKSLLSLSGLLLFLAIALPWHLAIAKDTRRDAQGRTWTQEYVIRQHVGRFKGMDQVHNLAAPAYIGFFLIGFFPWSCFALAAFRVPKTLPNAAEAETSPELEQQGDNEAHRFLLVWFWTIFLFFSVSAAKLPTYIVPAYPAAALLVGRWLDRTFRESSLNRSLIRGAIGAVITSALLLIAVSMAPRWIPKASPLPSGVQSVVQELMIVLLVGSMAACVGFGVKRKSVGIGILAGMMLVMMGIGATQGYTVAAQNVMLPFQQSAIDANHDADHGVPVLFYNIVPRRPSMLFYSAYSPIETRETPLVPYLRSQLGADCSEIQIITSTDTLNASLRAAFDNAPDLDAEYHKNKGWVGIVVRRR